MASLFESKEIKKIMDQLIQSQNAQAQNLQNYQAQAGKLSLGAPSGPSSSAPRSVLDGLGGWKAARGRPRLRSMPATNYSSNMPVIFNGSPYNIASYSPSMSSENDGSSDPNYEGGGSVKPKNNISELSQAAKERRAQGQPRWYDLIPGDIVEGHGRKLLIGNDGHWNDTINGNQGTFSGNAKTVTTDGWVVTLSKEKPKAKVDFDSVILPIDKKNAIIDAIKQVDNHDLIFNEWGFGDVFEKGTAISMLFYGPPGTGKTLMAQAIADRYDYKLTVISTAEVETPEPGGAERNIQRYFKEAGENSVLLFDECDSLISDRKHLGMIMAAQVNALLTALENHKGVVLFTTNRLGALDPAFDRRLSLKLEFEMPDLEHRVKIWQRMFPKQAPVAKDIDWETIAGVEIAGGHIKNVVMRAARRAANTTKKITQDIIADALVEELKANENFQNEVENHGALYGSPIAAKTMSQARQAIRTKGGLKHG